jgi:twitching motility two-component system response regulator PilG
MSDLFMSISEISHSQKAVQFANNPPIDPRKALEDIAARCADGYLHACCNDLAWRIYFRKGNLQYASSSFQSLTTLDYHFRCVGFKNLSVAHPSFSQAGLVVQSEDWLQPSSVNTVITWFLNQGHLNLLQVTRLLENLTKEAIETFLWLTEGHFQWVETSEASHPKLDLDVNLDLNSVLTFFQDRISQWQNFSPLVQSPYQRPYLFSQNSESLSSPDLAKLGKLLRGMSIRQIASVLNQDELAIAQFLYPFIQRGDVYLGDPQKPYQELPKVPQLPPVACKKASRSKTFKVACIDDSPTILDEMYRFLNHDEYEVTRIGDPVKAASVLFRLKPDLVLMDITMPEINGYKLCGLLRNSVALRETPIVMVTGRSGLVDRARAKVAGATDYLIKPFTRGSLLAVVEKYLH